MRRPEYTEQEREHLARIYRTYHNIKSRCYLPTFSNYRYYGGKGIKMCDKWKRSFKEFFRWSLENGYYAKMILVRKNKDGDFEPNNCEWAEPQKKEKGKKKLHYKTFEGETHHVATWARIYGIDPNTLNRRFRSGWKFEKAVTTPVRNYTKAVADEIVDDYDME